jgi:hypothetical protein
MDVINLSFETGFEFGLSTIGRNHIDNLAKKTRAAPYWLQKPAVPKTWHDLTARESPTTAIS